VQLALNSTISLDQARRGTEFAGSVVNDSAEKQPDYAVQGLAKQGGSIWPFEQII